MKLKIGDIAVIIVSFCLFIGSFVFCFSVKENGKKVKIYENNEIKYSGSLKEDKVIKLSHNTVIIKNRKAYMEKSSCKNQICVKAGKISNSRECIVCLPNKVIIEIE